MCTPSTMRINEETADRRIGHFIKFKHRFLTGILTDAGGYKQENIYIICNPAHFIAMTTKLIQTAVSGVRMYLASYKAPYGEDYFPAGQDNLLTIIARPTRPVNDGDVVIREEDIPNNSLLVNENGFINLDEVDPNIALNWINNYIALKHGRLENKFGTETKSIWYDLEGIQSLHDELECYMAKGELETVIIYFGAYARDESVENKHMDIQNPSGYEKVDVFNQLTLLFLIETTDGTDMGDSGETLALTSSSDNDTGIPCPPRICQ